MKFVDRIDEAARLKDALAREKSSLVVMYGRRRLGKSTLIKRVLSDTDVYFLADRSEGQHQRVLLAKVIAQVFPDVGCLKAIYYGPDISQKDKQELHQIAVEKGLKEYDVDLDTGSRRYDLRVTAIK